MNLKIGKTQACRCCEKTREKLREEFETFQGKRLQTLKKEKGHQKVQNRINDILYYFGYKNIVRPSGIYVNGPFCLKRKP